MQTIKISLPKLHEGQLHIKNNRRRFNVINCGRRFGKNVLERDFAIESSLSMGRPTAWFSPTYKMMLDDWRELTDLLYPVTSRSNITERRIELISGGLIEFWSIDNPDVGRGRKYRRAIINEAAMIPKLKEAWENAIRPTLTDYRGDAYFDSTPKGQNYFFHLHQLADNDEDWAAFTMPTSANPYIAADEIEAARLSLPELTFRQEYLAEFLRNEGAVFRNILACMNAPATDPEKHRGHTIVGGLDWGKHHDFTAASVGCKSCGYEVDRARFNQIDYIYQRDKIMALNKKWGGVSWLAERNSIGDPNIEALQREGLSVFPFDTTATSKPPLIENLALVLEQASWQFQPDDLWKGELEAYERKVSPVTGRSQYNAPDGLHDDTVIARALMVWHADNMPWVIN